MVFYSFSDLVLSPVLSPDHQNPRPISLKKDSKPGDECFNISYSGNALILIWSLDYRSDQINMRNILPSIISSHLCMAFFDDLSLQRLV